MSIQFICIISQTMENIVQEFWIFIADAMIQNVSKTVLIHEIMLDQFILCSIKCFEKCIISCLWNYWSTCGLYNFCLNYICYLFELDLHFRQILAKTAQQSQTKEKFHLLRASQRKTVKQVHFFGRKRMNLIKRDRIGWG